MSTHGSVLAALVATSMALAAVACSAAPGSNEEQDILRTSDAVSETQRARLRTEVEVLSGARSEACTREGLESSGCYVLRRADQRTLFRYSGADAWQERISAVARYICDRFGAAGGVACDAPSSNGGPRVLMQRITANQRSHANIIAVVPGSDPAAGAIVIGAHHDSVTDAGPAPGAIDNATGVAILFDVFRTLVEDRARSAGPRTTVVLVAFAAEEGATHASGSDGSRAYVGALAGPACEATGAGAFPCASRVDAMLNLDMLALPRLRRSGSSLVPFAGGAPVGDHVRLFAKPGSESCTGSPAGDSAHQALGRSLAVAALKSPGDLLPLRAETTSDRVTNGYARFSDHFSFHEAKIPAVRLIGPSAVDEAGLNHSQYDRTSRPIGAYEASMRDEDQILDWDYLARSAELVTGLVRSLTRGVRAPKPVVEVGSGGGRAIRWDEVPGAHAYVVALRRAAGASGEHTIAPQDIIVVPEGHAPRLDIPAGFRTAAIAAIDADGVVGPLGREVLLEGTCRDLAPPACASPVTAGDCDDDP